MIVYAKIEFCGGGGGGGVGGGAGRPTEYLM